MSVPDVSGLLDFSGRIVLVTGAAQGIGRGIAERFSEAGASVAVHYRSRDVEAEAVAERIGGFAVGGDLSRPEEVSALFDAIESRLGPVDVVVNNAGIYPLHELLDMSPEDWHVVVDANLTSTHFTTQDAAKRMKARGATGAIVNIASIEGLVPAPSHSHYNAAKGGVLMYTRAAALELGPHKIRVNAVSPGLIWRDGIEEAWPDGVERFHKRAPLERLGRADDVADACLFLASDAARWITGANLVVDGGVLAATAF